MKILKRILIAFLILPILFFLVWLGIFTWNSSVDLNIPDVDTGSLMPQVQSIPDDQNGYLLIQKLYSEEFQDIRKKHCGEINIDQKICQMEWSDLLFGGSTRISIDSESASRDTFFSSEPFGVRSSKNRFITPDEIRLIQSQYLSGEYQQSFETLNISLDEIMPKMEEIMNQHQFVPVLPKIDIRDESTITASMPAKWMQEFARNISYSAILDCLAGREDECVRKTLFLYRFSQKMKEGTTNMIHTMIVMVPEKQSTDLLLYILKNISLSETSKSQIKEVFSMPIIAREEWKKRMWQFEYYQTNEFVNQTLDRVNLSHDWDYDMNIFTEWFSRLTLDRKETQKMLDYCIFIRMPWIEVDNRCEYIPWLLFWDWYDKLVLLPGIFDQEDSLYFFQRKNILWLMAVRWLIPTLSWIPQKIDDVYRTRDKILEELQ